MTLTCGSTIPNEDKPEPDIKDPPKPNQSPPIKEPPPKPGQNELDGIGN